ncbi:helix-turn-helix domain-containing protein [Sphingobium sp. SCG-1]|uniref:helix-turn-helix domain-containing protein n=1 Tax=Sphingobium sp. SCG-1 TaxID=2072936 RepID=UPI0016700997|nr:helix-turn-helix transcriptional regulator [Sphingobium sp. SCG-1]
MRERIQANEWEAGMGIPTAVLRKAREEAGIKQGDMAARLGVSSNSVVSRLERTETTDEAMARRYLEAIDTEESRAILTFYSREWSISDRPAFGHPDRELLWSAEQALQQLARFEGSEDYDALLAAPINLFRTNLLSAAEFLGEVEHSLAWIGSVGVGKTTALSHLTNLMVPGPGGRPQPVFPASGGRTTTSEVAIRTAPAFGIMVEPKPEDEVRLIVGEMVRAAAEGAGGVSTEIDRAIRNMAELKRRKNPTDPRSFIDPIKEMIETGGDQDDVVQDIVNRMRLEQRTETQMILSETTVNGLEWLSKNITAINFGQHARFSLPQRVTVYVPESAMRRSGYRLNVIDTKGILGTTERADLMAHLAEPRTLSILCCAFNDAPGTEALKIAKTLQELRLDAVERQRVILLALPRGDEALKVITEDNEPPEDAAEGYAIRAMQVEDSLREAGVPPIPVLFFNAMEESAPDVWSALCRQIDAMRSRQHERLSRFVALSHDLVSNTDAARIQQARITLADEVERMVGDYRKLPNVIRPAHQRLLDELQTSHASSIAAAVARRGNWDNFEMHFMIGSGVRADANLRTAELFSRINGRLDALTGRFSNTREAQALVETLAEELSEWQQEFLGRALTIGRNTFKPYLDKAEGFWSDLWARYGQGSGYRDDIAAMVREWFEETPELVEARNKIDARLTDAWDELVLQQLVEATRISEVEVGL